MEIDTEYSRHADRHVGVSTEIAIYLEGEEIRRERKTQPAMPFGIGVHGIDVRTEIVGDGDLLEQAPEHQNETAVYALRADAAGPLQLSQKMTRALDGTGDEMREVRDEQQIGP